VITIWGGKKSWGDEDRMGDRVRDLKALGCERVTTFGQLAWKYPAGLLPYYSVDLPHKVHDQADEVRAAFQLWSDDSSRQEYVNQVRWRLRLDFDCLADPVAETMYFPPDLLELSPDEIFIDCGAYDGDTLDVFLRESRGQFRKIVALEPDPANFAKLQSWLRERLGSDDRSSAFQFASGARRETISFIADGSDAARVGTSGADGVVDVQSVALDELLAGSSPTFLKMDIEGSEFNALTGARGIIAKDRPILAICSYHLQNDLWKLPLLINSFTEGYEFFLRPHKLEVWDLVTYAVPKERRTYRANET